MEDPTAETNPSRLVKLVVRNDGNSRQEGIRAKLKARRRMHIHTVTASTRVSRSLRVDSRIARDSSEREKRGSVSGS